MNARRKQPSASEMPAARGVETTAVIEIGTTSIRMALAELPPSGAFRILDTLQQPVSLGKDAFTGGTIEPGTTEQCVQALRWFLQALREVGTDTRRIRIVATSAVREAVNREAFLDRIAIATGLNVDVLNEAEVSRLTYLAVRPALDRDPAFRGSDTVVVEVGGGSTEALVFRRGKIVSSHMYRLGSLRLRGLLDDTHAPDVRTNSVLSHYVSETAGRIVESVATHAHSSPCPLRLVALGSEARFACARLIPRWQPGPVTELRVKDLTELTQSVLDRSVDEAVRRYKITYPEAETLGPSLMVLTHLARAMNLKSILVCDASLRSGLLAEMSAGGAWTTEFRRQIVNSALATARKYDVNMTHARNVMRFCHRIFDAMRDEHRLGPSHEAILGVAALLHECGHFVNDASHHKHSFYLVRNSDVFGLGTQDLLYAALVARYHRGAEPKPTHVEYMSLTRDERILVSKMAAILRVANALDAESARRARQCRVTVEPGVLAVAVEQDEDPAIWRHLMRERSVMFERVYGMRVELRPLHRESME